MADLHTLDIAGLQAAYAAGETTPSAAAEHYLDRIARFDPALRAFIEVDRERAMQAAAESDLRIEAAAPRALEGVPVAIKSNIAVAGLEWNAGMETRRGLIAEHDAEAVRRLRDAGAVILGTLNMHEAALGATTDNRWFGRAINPHRPGFTPGGSSGGSGAAVAAGLCVAALGTDTLGSVRIPAAYCGVYGLKPTHNAISAEGLAPLSGWLDAIGPLARSLDDLEAVARVLADLPDAPPPARLLVLEGLGKVDCEPAVLATYERALAALDHLSVTRFAFADDPDAIRLAGFVDAARELAGHIGDRAAKAAALSPELTFLLDFADRRDARQLAEDAAILARARAELTAALGSDGVLLMPATPQAAFAHSARAPVSQAGFSSFANIAGLPALALPAGRDANGLPVGVQLVGSGGSDLALVELGRVLDAALAGYAPPPGYF